VDILHRQRRKNKVDRGRRNEEDRGKRGKRQTDTENENLVI